MCVLYIKVWYEWIHAYGVNLQIHLKSHIEDFWKWPVSSVVLTSDHLCISIREIKQCYALINQNLTMRWLKASNTVMLLFEGTPSLITCYKPTKPPLGEGQKQAGVFHMCFYKELLLWYLGKCNSICNIYLGAPRPKSSLSKKNNNNYPQKQQTTSLRPHKQLLNKSPNHLFTSSQHLSPNVSRMITAHCEYFQRLHTVVADISTNSPWLLSNRC